MRWAVVSDIHGNIFALEAVLADIATQSIDQTLCAGDLVNPLPWSENVIESLRARSIPTVRGNHEDYLVQYFSSPEAPIHSAAFRPIQLTAEKLGRTVVNSLSELPFELETGPDASLWLLHASPLSNTVSFQEGVCEKMGELMSGRAASLLVSGHRHRPWQGQWREKVLVSVGSVGMPRTRGPEWAEYTILTLQGGKWIVENRFVEFDLNEVLRGYGESGWVSAGGATAWALFDEFRCGELRLPRFFDWLKKNGHPIANSMSQASLNECMQSFLEEIGSWNQIKRWA